jgi:aryl-alcohol dehydrogenase-like predicted oxidoreductase
MRKIELSEGLYSSALGFGCAPILGAIDGKKAARAIECAIETGVNHFDLARSYGFGEAESFVGKILKGRRDKVILASKFGIRANWKAQLFRPAKPIFRLLKGNINRSTSKSQSFQNTNHTFADSLHTRIPLTNNEIRRSLEKSLRALRTDYLDYFFIHEPLESLTNHEDLFGLFATLKKEGKIRSFGLAYMRSQQELHSNYINNFQILQFDCSPGAHNYYNTVQQRGNQSNVLFSPLRGRDSQLNPGEKLQKLFNDFPNSVILCSMFNEEHINTNADLAG